MIPLIRINNRRRNIEFYKETLGLKVLLEEGAFVDLGDKEGNIGLRLQEAPGTYAHKVRGPKRLVSIVLKASDPKQVVALLARTPQLEKIYQGQKGWGFEVLSPEGDRFVLHAEDSLEDLREVELRPPLEVEDRPEYTLTSWTLERMTIRTPDVEGTKAFYHSFDSQGSIHIIEGQGQDLQTEDLIWDLSTIFFSKLGQERLDAYEKLLTTPYYREKRGRFIQTEDPNHIEIWLER